MKDGQPLRLIQDVKRNILSFEKEHKELKEDHGKLEEDFEKLEEDYNHVKKKYSRLKSEYDNKLHQINNLKNNLFDCKEEMKDLKKMASSKRKDDKDSKIKKLQELLNKEKSHLENEKKKTVALEKMNEDLKIEINRAKVQIESDSECFSALKVEIEKLSEAKVKEIKDLKGKHKEAEEQKHQELEKLKTQGIKELQERNQEIIRLKSELHELNERANQIKDFQELNLDLELLNNELEAQSNELKEDNRELLDQKRQIIEQKKGIETQNIELTEQNRRIMDEYKKLLEQHNGLKELHNGLMERNKELEFQNKELLGKKQETILQTKSPEKWPKSREIKPESKPKGLEPQKLIESWVIRESIGNDTDSCESIIDLRQGATKNCPNKIQNDLSSSFSFNPSPLKKTSKKERHNGTPLKDPEENLSNEAIQHVSISSDEDLDCMMIKEEETGEFRAKIEKLLWEDRNPDYGMMGYLQLEEEKRKVKKIKEKLDGLFILMGKRENEICNLCCGRTKTTVIEPCRHVMCLDCFKSIKTKKCPFCSQFITGSSKTFWSS